MTQTQLLELEIKMTEIQLRKKKKRLAELSKKYSVRSLSQMFPEQSGNTTFTIDSRQDAV